LLLVYYWFDFGSLLVRFWFTANIFIYWFITGSILVRYWFVFGLQQIFLFTGSLLVRFWFATGSILVHNKTTKKQEKHLTKTNFRVILVLGLKS
jgi:hypothetical protein